MDLEGFVATLGIRKCFFFCGVEEILRRIWKGLGRVLWIWKDLEVSADL